MSCKSSWTCHQIFSAQFPRCFRTACGEVHEPATASAKFWKRSTTAGSEGRLYLPTPASSIKNKSMRSLPPGLVAKVRSAFQACSRQHAASKRTQFSTFRPLFKKSAPSKKKDQLPIQVVHSQLQAQKEAAAKAAAKESTSKGLVPSCDEAKSLDTGRRVEVPLKVIPKAEITPNLTLSPKERLQIEQLTRRLPPRAEPQGRPNSRARGM